MRDARKEGTHDRQALLHRAERPPQVLILDFEGDAVTLEFRISVNNSGGPFVLTLAPDNTLHGSGSTTVNGRILVNLDANSNPVFRPVSAACSVNTFSSRSSAEYRALITNPPAPGR